MTQNKQLQQPTTNPIRSLVSALGGPHASRPPCAHHQEWRAGEVHAPLLGTCDEISLNEAANGAGLGSSYSARSASMRNEQEQAPEGGEKALNCAVPGREHRHLELGHGKYMGIRHAMGSEQAWGFLRCATRPVMCVPELVVTRGEWR